VSASTGPRGIGGHTKDARELVSEVAFSPVLSLPTIDSSYYSIAPGKRRHAWSGAYHRSELGIRTTPIL